MKHTGCANFFPDLGGCLEGHSYFQENPCDDCDSYIPKVQYIYEMFTDIRRYHEALGAHEFDSGDFGEARDVCLALHAEVSELLESFPWKPWRPQDYQDVDHQNIKEELIDILFFVGGFAEIFGITGEDLASHFNYKLAENYDRIRRKYNDVATRKTVKTVEEVDKGKED